MYFPRAVEAAGTGDDTVPNFNASSKTRNSITLAWSLPSCATDNVTYRITEPVPNQSGNCCQYVFSNWHQRYHLHDDMNKDRAESQHDVLLRRQTRLPKLPELPAVADWPAVTPYPPFQRLC